ncbi:MAG: hypothetical protein APR54_12500 [Candidatus Cloacimonas sp. SDB]|nr:MAG: hypothetical protein APR54_12500 [Candidatus Cloacimonas sp. SDB]
MKHLSKYLSFSILFLMIIVLSSCEGLSPVSDISEGNPDAQCPQAGYIYHGSTYNPIWVNGYSIGDGSQYLYQDNMYLNADQSRGISERSYVTDNPIDLTCINSVVIDWENVGWDWDNNRSYLVLSSYSKYGKYDDNEINFERIRPFTRRIDTLDVSALTGNYYIRIHAIDDGTDGTSTINVYSVELLE